MGTKKEFDLKSFSKCDSFPKFNSGNNLVTSPATPQYNCICWAASRDDLWWWPDQELIYYWPPGVPRVETVDAFVAAYRTVNYKVCKNGSLEENYEKIAIYVDISGSPTHAARQLLNGKWTSKLGRSYDIQHEDEFTVEGPAYGRVAIYMKRTK